MLEAIKSKIKTEASSKGMDDARIATLLSFIEEKIGDKEILSSFISNPYHNYGVARLKEGHIAIDIVLPKYIFGMIFSQNFLAFDFTPYSDVYSPITEIEKDKIKIDFPLKAANRSLTIISHTPADFDKLLSFADICTKLIIGE